MWHHLAQFNLARLQASLDDPRMSEYGRAIPLVNKLASRSPGFVWRSLEDGPDTLVMPTLSIWESPAQLRAFVHQSGHVEMMKRRAEWLLPFGAPNLALWWIPAGHRPMLVEAYERLAHLTQYGPSHVAFAFNPPFLAPASPADSDGEVPKWSYDGRTFGLVENSENGDNRPGVIFHYHQYGNRVWANYHGPSVRFGSLVARVEPDGALDMRYQHWGPGGLRTGQCRATPEWLGDGRLRMHEEWQWTNGDRTAGRGIIEEPASE